MRKWENENIEVYMGKMRCTEWISRHHLVLQKPRGTLHPLAEYDSAQANWIPQSIQSITEASKWLSQPYVGDNWWRGAWCHESERHEAENEIAQY